MVKAGIINSDHIGLYETVYIFSQVSHRMGNF